MPRPHELGHGLCVDHGGRLRHAGYKSGSRFLWVAEAPRQAASQQGRDVGLGCVQVGAQQPGDRQAGVLQQRQDVPFSPELLDATIPVRPNRTPQDASVESPALRRWVAASSPPPRR